MLEITFALSIANLVGVLYLYFKSQAMVKLLWLLGAKNGWCDENGRPLI